MIQLRPEDDKDFEFIESVYCSTREGELKLTNWTAQQQQAFIMMQSMAQLAEYKSKFPGAAFQIIIFKKQRVGRFYVMEGADDIRLIDITVLPAFRGKGIGAFLLDELIKKADSAQKKISLHVDPGKPVLHFYQRLGFVHKKNNGLYYYMERNPAGFSESPVTE